MVTFKRIENGSYVCVEFPNYTIKRIDKNLWIGIDSKKETSNVCCSGNTLKQIKDIVKGYINNGCWYNKN